MSGNPIGFGEEIKKFCQKSVLYACLSGVLRAPSKKRRALPRLLCARFPLFEYADLKRFGLTQALKNREARKTSSLIHGSGQAKYLTTW